MSVQFSLEKVHCEESDSTSPRGGEQSTVGVVQKRVFNRKEEQEFIFNLNGRIQIYIKNGEVEKAQKQFEEIISFGIQPDAYSYSFLAQVYAKKLEPKDPSTFTPLQKIYQETKTKGIKPILSLFHAVLAACAKMQKRDYGLKVVKDLKNSGLAFEVRTYNILIDFYKKCGLPKDAQETFDAILPARKTPSVYSFTTIISMYCLLNDKEMVKKLFQQMLTLGVKPDEYTFTSIIDLYIRLDDIDAVETLYQQSKTYFDTTLDLYITLLVYFTKKGNTERIKALFTEVSAKQFPISCELFKKINEICKTQRDDATAAVCARRMQESGVKLDEKLTILLMELFLRLKEYREVHRLYTEAKDKNRISRPMIYELIIECYGKQNVNTRAYSLISEMRSNKIKPNVYIYRKLLDFCKNPPDIQRANFLMNEMEMDRLKPNKYIYSSYLNCLCHSDQWKEADPYFEKIKREMEPDQALYRIIFTMHKTKKNWNRVRELLLEMKQKGINLDTCV